ncbi:MAG: purine-nucleoside/S-methyl-5-thioadenosine phosphorylase / adenosine deaminase [Acidobacteriaceae bacterium]|jgi:YfiH family protein|nr:purine-nucleoside/S-methyl-5-thioadenosine phosphorylase / adenosine deaminase [Acidobacteriaceae bacterium]
MTPTKTKTLLRTPAARNKPQASREAWKLRTSENGIGFLQVPAFSAFPWLAHGFSISQGGVSPLNGSKVLNLGFTEWDARENVQKNRKLFQSALNANEFALVSLKQFHSDVVCDFSSTPKEPCSGDASISNTPNLSLSVQTADCVPILLLDPKKRSVAAVHAGWRGTLQRIVEKTIGRMKMEFKTNPSDLLAAIGPAIGGCCYEVGTEVAAAFLSQFANAPEWFDELRTGDEPNPLQWLNQFPPGHQPPPKNVRLDLRKANRAQLLSAGLRPQNIFVSDLCTACRPDLLFSYRKQGSESGRMMSVIGIRGENKSSRK